MPLATCEARVLARRSHPTLPPTEESRAVVRRFAGLLVPPSRREGFAHVWRIGADVAARDAADAIMTGRCPEAWRQ